MPPQETDPNSPPGEGPESQPLSGIWFQKDDPQILIQWTLNPSGPDGSDYTAQVRIYQLAFDAQLPGHQGPIVPFNLTDPSDGAPPNCQGRFVLTQNPLILQVMDLRFPGLDDPVLTLFPASSTES